MVDLTPYTTIAADTIRAKIISDAERMVARPNVIDYAIGSVWMELPGDVRERLYGLLAEIQTPNSA